MNWKIRRFLFLSILLSFFTFYSGYAFGRRDYELHFSKNPIRVELGRKESAKRNVDFSSFFKVWDLLHQEYLGRNDIHDRDLIYGALSGLVQALGDPYTAFLNPEENEMVKAGINGEYEGIGAELGMRDSQLVIIAPLEGSPAEEVGIKAGDKILMIDGVGTRGISLSEAVSKIRGKAGTPVRLTLARGPEGSDFDVTVIRGRITLASVKWEPRGDGIFYVRISRFGGRTASEWDEAVEEILRQGSLSGLILDLRNNPGGVLSAAVEIASEFIDQGAIVTEEFADGSRQDFKSTRLGRLTTVPVVVLLNKGSASASEILAAALKCGRRAEIVGERSFGKGTVQDARDLSDGSGVHITVAKWLTPEGKWVNGEGIAPDYEVEITDEDVEAGRDPQLEKAIEVLGGV